MLFFSKVQPSVRVQYQSIMIKIERDKNRYLPTFHNNKQSRPKQNRNLKTEYSTFTIQEEFKTIASYFKLFDTIRHKNSPRIKATEHSPQVSKHLYKSQIQPSDLIQSKVQLSQINHTTKKLSEVVKQHQKHKKRYSCHDGDRSYQRQNWMQTILRRKNNGSYGQIVRGLTNVKHDTLLQRFQAISSHREQNNQKPLQIDMDEKFVPLSPNKNKNQLTSRKSPSKLSGKKRMILYKKKSKITAADYFDKNIRVKSQRNQKIPHKSSFQSSLQLKGNDYTKITKKLSEPHKIQKHNLGPWDAL